MEKVTPILWLNSRASMELSTSLDPFLINSEARQNATIFSFLYLLQNSIFGPRILVYHYTWKL